MILNAQAMHSNANINFVKVTTKYLNGLIELIHSNLSSAEGTGYDSARRHFQRTLDYIASREYEGVVTNPPTV